MNSPKVNKKTRIQTVNTKFEEPIDLDKSKSKSSPKLPRGVILSPPRYQNNKNKFFNKTKYKDDKIYFDKAKYKEGDFKCNVKGQRNWCFTFYPDENSLNINNINFNEYFEEFKQIKYIIMGKEICPKTNKLHYQSYIYTHNNMTFSAVKKLLFNILNKYVHFEPCFGTPIENVSYCSKDNDYQAYGEEPKEQGTRMDLFNIREKIKNKETTLNKIMDEMDPTIYFRYGRVLRDYQVYYDNLTKRDFMTTCEWIYGKTKTGKSKYVFEQCKDKTYYQISLEDNGWWDGYNGEDIVIINEYRENKNLNFRMLLELIDTYPFKVKRRNIEPRQFTSKHIIITSPLTPQECFKDVLNENDKIDQLLRRINIKHFTKSKIIDIPYLNEDNELLKKCFNILKKNYWNVKYSEEKIEKIAETNIIRKNRWNRHKNTD